MGAGDGIYTCPWCGLPLDGFEAWEMTFGAPCWTSYLEQNGERETGGES